ncbi:SORCS3 [Branchiostoma lanceolatum]|uniref:SORCS3 protein n=1 Tax=Branchiostoma lanceolatum TaxID=7740 RepID=A0A8J9ZR09_BRALA|nr:SORCS3 [Branchiostoma lanceolatum]
MATAAKLLGCVFVLILIFNPVWTKITSRKQLHRPQVVERSTSEDSDPLDLHRSKRSTHVGGIKSTKSRLESSVFVLGTNRTNHNQAIIHWSGENSEAIFVLTRRIAYNQSVMDSTFWRSTDDGHHFNNETSKFAVGTVLSHYYVCPINKNKLIAIANNKSLYYTDDEGETYHLVQNLPFQPTDLTFHPSQDDWVLGYDSHSKKLYISMNLGQQWNTLHTHVTKGHYFWGVKGVDKDDHLVHMEVYDSHAGGYLYVSCLIPHCSHKNAHRTLSTIDKNSLLVQDQYIFVEKSAVEVTMYVSWKRGDFQLAVLPRNVRAEDFHILSTDEDQVFLAANHRDNLTSLYLSDTTGLYYVLTLENVVALSLPSGFLVDVQEVKGLKGTFVANQHTPRRNPRTLITWDKGGEWSMVQAPEKDIHGQLFNCTLPSCSLHLHMDFSKTIYHIPSVMSRQSSVGLVMAQGNVGDDLDSISSDVYVSHNGGLTWAQVLEDRYYVVFTDHGGAIVAVKLESGRPTDTLEYSCTEGQKWESFKFTDTPLLIDGVLNEPGEATLIILVFGHLQADSRWYVVRLDFGSILTAKCTDQDYTTWVPSDQLGRQCLLGERKVYERRKMDSECYNGRNYEREINTTVCQCTPEDFECDYGFQRSGANRTVCTVTDWFDPNQPLGECPEGHFFLRSSGYRKIPSDNCTGGVTDQYKPREVPCPLQKAEGLHLKADVGPAAPTHTNVTFHLTQDRGSKASTVYTWDFGDGVVTSQPGLRNTSTQVHSYDTAGTYAVSVSANNSAGCTSTTMYIKVNDKITTLKACAPSALCVNKPWNFTVTPLAGDGHVPTISNQSGLGLIHYVWDFDDEEETDTKTPLLSWRPSMLHMYRETGAYSWTVEAINPVSRIQQEEDIQVYDILKTLELSFTATLDMANKGTAQWRQQFGDLLEKQLQEVLNVSAAHLAVTVFPYIPTRVLVSVFPPCNLTAELSVPEENSAEAANCVNELTKSLKSAVDADKVTMILAGGLIVKALRVYVLQECAPPIPEPQGSYQSVIIGVLVLLIIILLLLLLAYFWKRKRERSNWYSQMPAPTSLMNEQGEMLSPAEDLLDQEITEEEFLDDIEDDSFQPVSQPTLVMMSGVGPSTGGGGNMPC